MRIVVYTVAFGEKYGVIEQPKFKGVDYICFTDQPKKSKTWKSITIDPKLDDNTRKGRFFKILPHKYLSEYDVSIFIDSNFLIVGDIVELVEKKFKDQMFMCYDHMYITGDERDCLYEEYEYIVKIGSRKGKYKDDPEVMRSQIQRYKQEGYPKNHGLVCTGVLVRRHNDPEVISLMEDWWTEITQGSKRDQLSFNYLCWRNNFSYTYLEGNILENSLFHALGSVRKNYTKKYLQYKFKKILGRV